MYDMTPFMKREKGVCKLLRLNRALEQERENGRNEELFSGVDFMSLDARKYGLGRLVKSGFS